MSNVTATIIIVRETSSLAVSLVLAAILSQLLYMWVSRLGPLSTTEAELELDGLEVEEENQNLAPNRSP